MKNLFKSIASVAIVAMAFAGCSKEATDVTAPITKKGVTVRFNAEVIDETRATLTPNDGETAFAAAWEDKDQIGIHAYVLDSLANEYADENIIGEWKNGAFEATFVNCPKLGESWEYGAYYPHVASCDASQNVTVPFGAMRTQSDNSYNSQYDIMVSDKVSVDDGANAGKDKDGNDIVFPMHRLSAIAYFHFTTDKAELQNEKVVSVTLTVDDGKVIAADSVKFCYTTNTPKIETVGNGTNSIELTYDEANRPTANDFTAWFNLLPVDGVTSVAVEIETENYVATIERKTTASALNYEAGKLYKVAGKISDSKWTKKSGGESDALTVDELVEAINGGTVAFTGKRVKGFVAAMAADGTSTLSNGTLILVSNSGKQNSAVKLFDNPSVTNRAVDAEGLQVGYEVLVYLDNAEVNVYGGNSQLNGITADEVEIQSDKVNDIVATNVTIAEYNANYAKYENMYLAFENVEPSQEYASAATSSVLTFTDGVSTLNLYNNKRWTEGAAIKLGKQQGTLYGFAQSYNGTPQVSNTDVNQLAAFMPTCTLSADKLSFAVNASAAQTVEATLESGYSLGNAIVDADWVTATVSGTNIAISVSANSGEERTATVTVNVLKDGKIADAKTITVTQDACFISNPTIDSGASLTTATIKATWKAVANADSYDWYLTAADGTTKINGASGNIAKPTSGDTVTLSADVSACGLTKDTKYVLYVKSVAATDYKVKGDEGKAELTCAEAAAVEEKTATFDLTNNEEFAKWSATYMSHTLTYDAAKIIFTSADKNTSTIKDCPVTKGQPIEVVLNNNKAKITAITITLKQWNTNKQTATLYYSTDGRVNYEEKSLTTSSNFVLSSSNLPEGTNAVKVTFSSNKQVGCQKIEMTYVE